MTVVAFLYADSDAPLVVIDSLISNNGPEQQGVASPLLEDPDERAGDGGRPVGLARKFWRLPDGSLYFYAGNVGAAERLFDHIGTLLPASAKYDKVVHEHARDYLTRMSESLSFIVAVPGPKVELFALGRVSVTDVRAYGTIALIGSGREAALNILEKSKIPEPHNAHHQLLCAYDVAARWTLDYVKTLGPPSQMSANSCGGYFEVVEPKLYNEVSSRLYRGTAHLFLEVTASDITLKRFVASRQDNDVTHILCAPSPDIYLENQDFLLDGSELQEYVVKGKRAESVLARPFGGVLAFAHVRGMILYARMVPSCGKPEHAMQTWTSSVSPHGPAIGLMPSDDHQNVVLVSLLIGDGEASLRRIAERLRKARVCPICASEDAKRQLENQ